MNREIFGGSSLLVVHGRLMHRFLLEVFLLERSMIRETLGGSKFLVVCGTLTQMSLVEVLLLKKT